MVTRERREFNEARMYLSIKPQSISNGALFLVSLILQSYYEPMVSERVVLLPYVLTAREGGF